ncbi:hypothetical protein ACFRAQ_34850 [Nocardia sp. NPDC056611]|uniref:hypothetical protein n=1 Tax=Nocardia sp. NPDC056611 TaxID=3345877 RepID=UPI00366BDEDA
MAELLDVRVLFVFTPEFVGDRVTAVFVDVPWSRDVSDGKLAAYAHGGQHCSVDREWVAGQRVATVAEYSELLRELFRVGYSVEVVDSFEEAKV